VILLAMLKSGKPYNDSLAASFWDGSKKTRMETNVTGKGISGDARANFQRNGWVFSVLRLAA